MNVFSCLVFEGLPTIGTAVVLLGVGVSSRASCIRTTDSAISFGLIARDVY